MFCLFGWFACIVLHYGSRRSATNELMHEAAALGVPRRNQDIIMIMKTTIILITIMIITYLVIVVIMITNHNYFEWLTPGGGRESVVVERLVHTGTYGQSPYRDSEFERV